MILVSMVLILLAETLTSQMIYQMDFVNGLVFWCRRMGSKHSFNSQETCFTSGRELERAHDFKNIHGNTLEFPDWWPMTQVSLPRQPTELQRERADRDIPTKQQISLPVYEVYCLRDSKNIMPV